jgi:hypothetical protein
MLLHKTILTCFLARLTFKHKLDTIKLMKKWLVVFCLLFLAVAPFNRPKAQETAAEESITIQTGSSFRDAGGTGYGDAVENTDQTGTINKEAVDSYTLQTIIPMALNEGLVGWNGKTLTLERFQKSVLGQTSQAMAYLYEEKPASTMEYLAWLGNRAGVVPKTYAQGVTFSRLLPILEIWKAFRDIAFALLAIIMLMIGLMIMFRAKVNPQTVANVENTIPRVVVTIILIWFSFPIASLTIDFMYVIIAAGIGVIGQAVGDPNVLKAIQDFSTGGFMVLFSKTLAPVGEFAKVGGSGSTIAIPAGIGLVGLLPGISWFAIPIGLFFMTVGGALTGAQAGGDWGAGIITALSPIFVLLIFIVLFFQVFKIFFLLLTAYIQILISIIISPLYLLFNAIPGRNTFTSWWKGIVANMLSFVVTAIMLYLGWAIASLISEQPFWTPPFIIQGAGASQMVVGLIALGIVLLIPQVIGMVKQALGVKPMFNVGPSMILGPVTGTVGQGVGLIGQFHTASQGLGALRNTPFGKFIPGKKTP